MKINFAKYLLELLLEQGKVNVPGLGKFQLERKSASFGDGRKTLVGPAQEILFSEEHDSNDTVLQDRIASKEANEVDAVKAGEFVNQFTSDVLKGLMENKEVEVAYLGTIKTGVNDQISFVQNQATVDKLNKYLPEVELPAVQKLGDISTPEVQKSETVIPVVKQEVPKVESSIEKKQVVETPKKEVRSTFRSDLVPEEELDPVVKVKEPDYGWLKWLLAIIGLVAFSTMAFKMCGKEDKDAYRSNQSEKQEQVATDDKTNDDQQSDGLVDDGSEGSEENPTDEIDFKSDEEVSPKSEMKTASDFNKEKCIVIIGSYQSSKNVRSATAKIESKGYDLYKETHGAYTRVGVSKNCEDINISYSNFAKKISREFGVNAWFLSPEVRQ